jgi:hypothetical protein
MWMEMGGLIETDVSYQTEYFSFISIKEFMGEEEDSAQKKAERAFDIIDR